MLDMEMSFISSIEDVMGKAEEMMASVCSYVADSQKEALRILGKTVNVPSLPFPRLTMDEAKKLLRERGLEYGPDDELDTAGEKVLGEIVKERFNHEFVFLDGVPVETGEVLPPAEEGQAFGCGEVRL
jgi:aspartyl-tRNA synthetase